jgi:hypothetical protein
MYDDSLFTHNHNLPSSLFTFKTKIKISNNYMMPKFNANIKFKLNSKTLKYVNMKKLNNNKMKRIKTPIHNTPKIPL